MESKKPLPVALSLLVWVLVTALFHCQAAEHEVRLSRTKICHTPEQDQFQRLTTYRSFPSLKACLEAGGQLAAEQVQRVAYVDFVAPAASLDSFSPSAFEFWSDDDGNCRNTQAELQLLSSQQPATLDGSGCKVIAGQWQDPYNGQQLHLAHELFTDHLVPLAWAWQRGARLWTPQKRRAFANDESNLQVISLSSAEHKQTRTPLEWLPENRSYQCTYLLRFQLVLDRYGLQPTADEQQALTTLKVAKCGKG